MVYCPKCGKSMASYVEHNCVGNEIGNEIKICKIINGHFSWILEVDGESITFQGGHNADYFETHYTKLGYNIEKIDRHNLDLN